MKYIKYLFSLILVLLIVSFGNVYAEEKVVKINVPKTVSKDQEFSVDIQLSTDVTTDGFKATLTYETTVLELVNMESKGDWHQDSKFSKESPLSLDFTHENGQVGDITIATLNFKVKSDASKSNTSITIEGTSRVKEDQTINTLEKVSANIEIKSTDNSLKDLKVNGKTINNFSPKQYEYDLVEESTTTTVNFEAVLNDKTATFKDKFGPKTGVTLEYGKNVFEIVVVAATGAEKKYVVTITRPDNRGTNNNLSDLIINSNKKLLEFSPNSLTYMVTTHKLETIDVEAVPQDPKAKVKIDKPEKLQIGTNTILITVTSEKNEDQVYKVTVNNLDTEIDTTLKDIELLGVDDSLNFSSNVYDYELMYKPNFKEDLVIKAVVSNSDEAIASKNPDTCSNLKPGDKVTITVSAKDGTKNVESYYTITFKKDTRINFFLILGLVIFIVLLIIFIRLLIKNRKEKDLIVKKEQDLEKTKRLEKVNLE